MQSVMEGGEPHYCELVSLFVLQEVDVCAYVLNCECTYMYVSVF